MTDLTNLDHLHDIIVSDPLAFWPPAPGWYVIATLFAAVSAWWAVAGYLRWQTNRYRRDALAELDRLENKGPDDALVFRQLPELVKRTALAAFGRETVASLTGRTWLEFLDRSLSTTEFTKGSGRLLIHLPYQRQGGQEDVSTTELNNLLALVRKWIKHHMTGQDIDKTGHDIVSNCR